MLKITLLSKVSFDVDFFTRLVLLCLFQMFNDLFFFVALVFIPKADTKV